MKQTTTKKVYTNQNWTIGETTLTNEKNETRTVSVAQRPSNVMLVAITTNREIFLVSEHCPAHNKTQLTLPKGKINTNEMPHIAAQRELQEEVKKSAQSLEKIIELEHAKIQGKTHVFLAKKLIDSPKDTEFMEELIVHKIPFDMVLDKIKMGEISEEKSVASILFVKNFCKID